MVFSSCCMQNTMPDTCRIYFSIIHPKRYNYNQYILLVSWKRVQRNWDHTMIHKMDYIIIKNKTLTFRILGWIFRCIVFPPSSCNGSLSEDDDILGWIFLGCRYIFFFWTNLLSGIFIIFLASLSSMTKSLTVPFDFRWVSIPSSFLFNRGSVTISIIQIVLNFYLLSSISSVCMYTVPIEQTIPNRKRISCFLLLNNISLQRFSSNCKRFTA